MLGIIYLLFLLKEARNRNGAAVWESQDLVPGAGSWSQESFGCNGAVVGINPMKKKNWNGEGEGRNVVTGGKKTQGNKGLRGQIGLGAYFPGLWLSILTKCCPERTKRGEMYFIINDNHIFVGF